ncbi:MAG: DoxX family protein [Bacteroidales bacterium]|nr:DoxX family protein [Bacteroidales bacterium]
MKTLFFLSRIFVGLVFVFSGFVKAVDPSGFAIKFDEYLVAFHLNFISGLAMPLAILASAAELMIGLNLLAGVRLKFTAWLLMAFMSFFTILTLILALTNPVSDCGCFGDAVILTNWQTFWKNIIILIPTLVLFIFRNRLPSYPSVRFDWLLAVVNFAVPVLISVYCLRHEPLLDFRPYKTGTYIPDQMIIPDNAPVDKYETRLVYQKDGLVQEFSETDFPWQDTTWKWVETKQKLISKGYEPPIHDFSISGSDGSDITSQVLDDSGYVFLIISPKIEKASLPGMNSMNELAMKAESLNIQVLCLTSSTNKEIENFRNSFRPAFELYSTDETTLQTILRSNPGLMALQRGTILAKWSHHDLPELSKLNSNVTALILEKNRLTHEKLTVILLIICILLFYSLAFSFAYGKHHARKKAEA